MAPIEKDETKKAVYISEWAEMKDETNKEKFARKAKNNPFVPLGCLLTVGALVYGLVSFKRGDARLQQKMMRVRVLAQGSTLLAIIGGLGYAIYLERQEDKKN